MPFSKSKILKEIDSDGPYHWLIYLIYSIFVERVFPWDNLINQTLGHFSLFLDCQWIALNSTIHRDSDGYNVFTIDPITGMIRTKAVLDHEERNVYRVSVKATDAGRPPRHSVRALRVEVLALADNRPTFTSSSFTFNVSTIRFTAR